MYGSLHMLIILEVSIQYQVVLLIFKKKRRDLVVSSYNFSLCGWSTDLGLRECNTNKEYPTGNQYYLVNGRYHRWGCGNCYNIWTNFIHDEGAIYGSDPVYFKNYYACWDTEVWYRSNSQFNFPE